MITEKEQILFLALCAYTYDSVCNINFDNIKSTGLGKDSIRKITQHLEEEGYIINTHVSGFFLRYTMLKEQKCPSKFLLNKTYNSKNNKGRYIEHNLTEEIITNQLEKQNNKDYYLGIKFNSTKEMSIDRIDSNKGYVENNIAITTNIINIMKNDLSIKEFKKHIILLYNNINNF